MSTLKVDTITKSDGTNSISQDAIITTSSPQLGRRNLFINGAMQVAQRGTSSTSDNGYFTVDRWFRFSNGSGLASGQGSDSDVGYYMYTTLNSSGYGNVQQRIERIPFIGAAQDYTLSFKAKVNTGTAPLRVEIGNNTDSTQIVNNTNAGTVTTSWQTFTIVQSFGTDDSLDEINVLIGSNGGSSGQIFYITEVQLELGSVATPFEHRSYGEELALCQRYYYQTPSGSASTQKIYWEGYSEAGSFAHLDIFFPTEMRAAPSCTVSGTFDLSGMAANPEVHTVFPNRVRVQSAVTGIAGRKYYSQNGGTGLIADAEL
jgi:hypothetical protein